MFATTGATGKGGTSRTPDYKPKISFPYFFAVESALDLLNVKIRSSSWSFTPTSKNFRLRQKMAQNENDKQKIRLCSLKLQN